MTTPHASGAGREALAPGVLMRRYALAGEIVDAILTACATFGGKFIGRQGKDRALIFPLIVKRDDPATEEPRDRMIAYVAKKLGESPPPSGDSGATAALVEALEQKLVEQGVKLVGVTAAYVEARVKVDCMNAGTEFACRDCYTCLGAIVGALTSALIKIDYADPNTHALDALRDALDSLAATPAPDRGDGPVAPVDGTWPADDLRRAFVRGAKWWEYESCGATMWQSDQRKAEAAAEVKYPNGRLPDRTKSE